MHKRLRLFLVFFAIPLFLIGWPLYWIGSRKLKPAKPKQEPIDQDSIQILDELDVPWREAWKQQAEALQ